MHSRARDTIYKSAEKKPIAAKCLLMFIYSKEIVYKVFLG